MFQVYVPHDYSVLDVSFKYFSCFRRMFHVCHLDVAMTIQICFNSIMHMLQRSNGCCRGDETLERGKGHGRDRARRKTGARQGWRHGEGRNTAWLGKERSGFDIGGATRMGIESWMVGRGH
jgi:hypothetical protein